jgi:iron complex outermembrane recepter protein
LTASQYNTFDYSGNPAYIKNNAHSNVNSFRGGLSHVYKFSENIVNKTALFGSGQTENVSSAGGWAEKLPANYGLRSTFDVKTKLGKDFTLSGVFGIETQRQNSQALNYSMVADSTNLTGYNIVGSLTSNKYTISRTTSLFQEWSLAMPYDFTFTAGIGGSTLDIEINDRLYVATNNKPSNKIPTQYGANYSGLASPHLALNKVFSKQISAYISYSKGYKAPVSSYLYIPVTGAVNTNLRPEIGNQLEIGSKGTLLDGNLNYQLAYFQAQFTDKLTTVAVANAAATATSYLYLVNGGTQNHNGFEALVKYTAYKSSDGFIKEIRPFVNLAYSDFKYENFKYQQLSGDKKSVVEVDYSGNKVAGVPPLTANFGLDFVSNTGLYLNAIFMHRDAMFYTSDNLNSTVTSDVLNGKLGFRTKFDTNWAIDAYFGIYNITGTQTYQMVFLNQLPDAFLPAPNKANYFGGLNLKYSF